MFVGDHQFMLCQAALIYAVTRWLLSIAINLCTSSMHLFSSYSNSFTQNASGSSCSCSCNSSNLKIIRDSLSLTTLGDIEHRLPENRNASCAVCLNKLRKKNQVWELGNCCHVFHKHCLERWLCYDSLLTCPLCRAPLITATPLPPTLQPSWAVERMLYFFGDDLLP